MAAVSPVRTVIRTGRLNIVGVSFLKPEAKLELEL
jgi:hypothetical protein